MLIIQNNMVQTEEDILSLLSNFAALYSRAFFKFTLTSTCGGKRRSYSKGKKCPYLQLWYPVLQHPTAPAKLGSPACHTHSS